jgi:hypothetical protein
MILPITRICPCAGMTHPGSESSWPRRPVEVGAGFEREKPTEGRESLPDILDPGDEPDDLRTRDDQERTVIAGGDRTLDGAGSVTKVL